jgi:hypothetical protein
MDLSDSPVANDSFGTGPFEFDRKLNRLQFTNLPVDQPAVMPSPDDDRWSTR